eukprot:3924463-Amphidinium_carterae.2
MGHRRVPCNSPLLRTSSMAGRRRRLRLGSSVGLIISNLALRLNGAARDGWGGEHSAVLSSEKHTQRTGSEMSGALLPG